MIWVVVAKINLGLIVFTALIWPVNEMFNLEVCSLFIAAANVCCFLMLYS